MLGCLLIAFSGCYRVETPTAASSRSETSSSTQTAKIPDWDPPLPEQKTSGPSGNAYLDGLITDITGRFATPEMSEYEKAKAAFDYIIENTVLDEPIGLALWRTHEGSETTLSFVENRSLSVLQYGVGMCEDYAAALTMLLRGLGLDAEYVPGLTFSLEEHLVDHSWVVAKVDGVWYHLDCQLEDNISRHNTIRYRYFMKSDATMTSSHRWGQNLINTNLLSPEQNAKIAGQFLYESCPMDYPAPAPQIFEGIAEPDIPTITGDAAAELAAYEQENGPLPPLELDIIPPVFGLEGYGPPDEG